MRYRTDIMSDIDVGKISKPIEIVSVIAILVTGKCLKRSFFYPISASI